MKNKSKKIIIEIVFIIIDLILGVYSLLGEQDVVIAIFMFASAVHTAYNDFIDALDKFFEDDSG